MQFYPADWLGDTRPLSLAAKGAWIDILCILHNSSTRGCVTLPVVGWARTIGASAEQAEAVIDELATMRVCDIAKHANGDVTLICRRMKRDSLTREQTRQRVAKHRQAQGDADGKCDGNTQRNAPGNGVVTGHKTEGRRQKTERKKSSTSSCPDSASPPPDPDSVKFVDWFLALLAETGAPKPVLTPSARALWADTYDKLIRIDGRSKDDIKAVCRWARNDAFWRQNFLSPAKLREKKDGVPWFDHFLTRSLTGSSQSPAGSGLHPQHIPAPTAADHRADPWGEPDAATKLP